MSTTIEWTQRPGTTGETWNPVVGCTKVSAGCKHCYAKTVHDKRHKAFLAGKLQNIPQYAQPFEKVQLMPQRLTLPLKWKKPRTVFVNSMSDLFHEDVPFDFIDQVFAVMAQTPQHTYQILTKRPERMAQFFSTRDRFAVIPPTPVKAWGDTWEVAGEHKISSHQHPLPDVWLGTSVENQTTANERIPHLLRCPAAVRFLSCEPLLGAVDLCDIDTGKTWPGKGETSKLNAFTGITSSEYKQQPYPHHTPEGARFVDLLGEGGIHWVIAGGESGPGARPMYLAWARSLRDQCKAAGVSYFFKQWGEHAPHPHVTGGVLQRAGNVDLVMHVAYRVGRKAAGHLLDGVEHHEWPKVPALDPATR